MDSSSARGERTYQTSLGFVPCMCVYPTFVCRTHAQICTSPNFYFTFHWRELCVASISFFIRCPPSLSLSVSAATSAGLIPLYAYTYIYTGRVYSVSNEVAKTRCFINDETPSFFILAQCAGCLMMAQCTFYADSCAQFLFKFFFVCER